MEWFQGGLADPPYANMSTTYMATFFVIALLVGGLFLAWEATHGLLLDVVATIEQLASELSPH